MARIFERHIREPPETDIPDWELLDRICQLFEEYRQTGDVLRFHADDPRGQYDAFDLDEFRAMVEAQEDEPKSARRLSSLQGFLSLPSPE
jgi:hypothetical protein